MFGHIYPSKLMVSMLLAGALAGGRAEQFAGSTRCMDRPANCIGVAAAPLNAATLFSEK